MMKLQSWISSKHHVFRLFNYSKDYLMIIVGILGTTISPYLFSWQASVEVEEKEH